MVRSAVFFVIGLVCVSVAVAAQPPQASGEGERSGEQTFSLPAGAQAVDSAGHVFSLGTRIDPGSNKRVEGYAILHYKDSHAKPDNPGNGNGNGKGNGNGGGGNDATASCYTFLAKGARRRVQEPWLVNGANNEGIDPSTFAEIVDGAVTKREGAANDATIFGEGTLSSDSLAAGELNDYNEVVFGSVESDGAIAVTIVWGVFKGPPHSRELVERDQIYDQVDFDWATDGTSTKMDLDNIVTHEMGHSFGLGDLYEDECATQTMYGYATQGETEKRDLEAGDIAGILELY